MRREGSCAALSPGRIARQPRPFDRGPDFIRPLRRRAALVVEYAPGLIERPVLVLGNRVLSDRVDENLHADNRVRPDRGVDQP